LHWSVSLRTTDYLHGLLTLWSMVSGPPPVHFGDATSANSTVTFYAEELRPAARSTMAA
jgi:hypothetical protein